jgi:hypothetical protein
MYCSSCRGAIPSLSHHPPTPAIGEPIPQLLLLFPHVSTTTNRLLLLLLHSQESTSQKTMAPPAPNNHFVWALLLVDAGGGGAKPIRHHAQGAGSAELNQTNLLQYTQARSSCFWSLLQNSFLKKLPTRLTAIRTAPAPRAAPNKSTELEQEQSGSCQASTRSVVAPALAPAGRDLPGT